MILTLLGLAIVYLAPPLADASRGAVSRGVSLAGDGFGWVASVVQSDFSSARELATGGDFDSAREMAREKLGSAARALFDMPENLMGTADPDSSSSETTSSSGSTPRSTASRSRSRERRQSRPTASTGSQTPPAKPQQSTSSIWPNVIRVGINASPWARITVDEFPIGETPIAGFPLLAGSYSFKATFPDGSSVEREIQVGPETRSIVFP